MTTPIETINWLSALFRDRANETNEENTLKDANEVDAARDAFVNLISMAEEAIEWVENSGIADNDPAPYKNLVSAIHKARGVNDDPSAVLLNTMQDFAAWEYTEGITVEHLANWMRERAKEAIDIAEGRA